MLKKIVLAAVGLLIVGLATAYFVRNMLVARAVEAGSTYALGVDTSVGSAAVEIGGGNLTLNDLEVSNPEGFTTQKFLSLRRGMLDVDAGSVLDLEVVIDSFIIEGVTLRLEQIDQRGNFQALLNHIKQLDMASSGESKKCRIGLIALRDINVEGSLSLLGKTVEKSYTLPDFTMRDVGGDHGASISEVTAQVVKALITKALAAGSGRLPEGFGSRLGDVKEQGIDQVKTEAANRLKELSNPLTGGKR